MIFVGATEYELRLGSALLGRLDDCDIVIDDPLVSRMHARIRADHEGVIVEDLHSTNGVFVNGERLTKPVVLNVGDRALVGTHEISFFESRTDPAPPDRESSTLSLRAEPPPSNRQARTVPRTPPAFQGAKDIPVTARADALRLVGSLARRFAEEGKVADAERVLSPHLRSILRGAAAGLELPDQLCQLASDLAFDLGHWTGDATWLDYVVELHLITKRLMTRQTVAGFQGSERWLGAIDRLLLQYYIESLAGRLRSLDAEEKTRYALLRLLLKA